MQHFRSIDQVALRESWLTIGVFDGVHRGHQAILRQLVAGAHQAGLPAVVLTFHPHPAVTLGKAKNFKYLTLPDEKAEALGQLGVDVVVTHPFTLEVSDVPAEEFMQLLNARLGLQALWVGYDFALGRGRGGDISRLTELGVDLGYMVHTVEAVADELGIISSRGVRNLVTEGRVAEAAAALDRYYSLSGPVVHGDARGRRIGIPTANVDIHPEKVVPANGVYACWAWTLGKRHPAVTNIGVRPTFEGGEPALRVETHLLDENKDLYGGEVNLEFVQRLRDEMKFPSVEALVEQIHADINKTREVLK